MADGFLGRWSRRKQEVREGKPVEEPPTPAPPLAASPAAVASAASASSSAVAPHGVPEDVTPVEAPPPTLADAEALTPASDFKAFVARDVSPEVRNLAMKKLFADPHFNVMDGLDIYIDDYTQPDPLPEGMLRKMTSAHALGFFDHEKQAEAETGSGAIGDSATVAPDAGAAADAADAESTAIAPGSVQPRDDAEGATPPDVAQSGVCNAIPSDPSSELALVTGSTMDSVAMPASHTEHDHDDAHLRLQPDDAPQRQGVGRGTA